MKNIVFIIFVITALFSSLEGKAETYDQKQGKNYQEIWAEGPPVSDAQLRAWLSLASTSVFDFSHKNYEDRQQENKKFFTTLGYMSFYNALKEAKLYDLITEKKQTISGYLLSPPKISKPILKNEGFLWEVDMVYAIVYENETSVTTQKLRVFVTVTQKEDAKDYETGDDLSPLEVLGIRKWVAEPMHEGLYVCSETETQLSHNENDKIDELQSENKSLRQRLEELLDYVQPASK
tara:strand:- start:42 stop:746 length:705 start_codon:yes stop_codon:yes gene_type:complete